MHKGHWHTGEPEKPIKIKGLELTAEPQVSWEWKAEGSELESWRACSGNQETDVQSQWLTLGSSEEARVKLPSSFSF